MSLGRHHHLAHQLADSKEEPATARSSLLRRSDAASDLGQEETKLFLAVSVGLELAQETHQVSQLETRDSRALKTKSRVGLAGQVESD